MKKLILIVRIWIWGTVAMFLLYIFCLFYKEIYPTTRTHFRSYHSFVQTTQFTIYAQELPESAHNLRYYVYEGYFDDKNGFYAAFSEKDYEFMKQNRIEAYHPEHQNVFCYDGKNKMYLDREQMKEWKVDYFDRLLPEEADDGQFYYLIYSLYEGSDIYDYNAVLCNDETYEMIELSCRDCYF